VRGDVDCGSTWEADCLMPRFEASLIVGRQMASVGDSVRKSIDDWELGEHQFAMLHACNAIDGTARKLHPRLSNSERFTWTIRDNYSIFGPMALPGIDLEKTRWPVRIRSPKATGGQPDIADVIYGIHRCTHAHGDELPDGYELISDARGPAKITHLVAESGKVRLSDRAIFGLLAVAILSPENADQTVPDGYHLTFAGQELPINDWWGRANDFSAIASQEQLPSVMLDFNVWMP
jgi:hypothetical protein